MSETPAGWYPDPTPVAGASSLRYWDGTAWTAHTAPALAPEAPTGPTTPDGEPLAGWWWRVLAYVIDGIAVGVVTSIVSIPAQIQMQREFQPVLERFVREAEQSPETPPDFSLFFGEYMDIFQAHWFWIAVPTVAFTVLYWAGFLRWKGATPGKLAVGLRVRLRDAPGTLPWWSIIARLALQFGVTWSVYGLAIGTRSLTAVAIAVPFAALLMLLDPLWATWDPKRQTLHDKLARTNVVKTR